MKEIYSSLVTKSPRLKAKALFFVLVMIVWMPNKLLAQEVTLTVPENYTGTTCMTQAEVDAAFNTWLTSAVATVTGDCEIISIVNDGTGAPSACGGLVEVNWTATSSCTTTAVESAVFTIPSVSQVTVIGPANVDASSCGYTDQAALDAAFATWIGAFEVTESGCGVTTPNLSSYSAPVLCTGGEVEIIYAVSDLCTNASITRTFKISAPPAVAVTGPANVDASSCDYADQAALDAAFATWIGAFEVTESGCGVTTPNLSFYSAPVLCTGGEADIIYAVSDLCTNASITRTFKITAPPEVVLNVPENLPVDGCYTQAQIQSYYNNWLGSATAAGGCNLVLSHNAPAQSPDNCGGAIEVTWTASGNCFPTQTGSSVFTVINNPEPVSLNLPDNREISSGFTQSQVNTQFNQWLALADYGGGCNSVITINNPGAPSACGGSTEVTWTVISDCEGVVSGSRTFSVDYTTMLYDNIISEENPYGALVDYYDARGTAYFTNGVSGSETNLVHWLDASWTRCLQDGVNIGHPNNNSQTPKPVANNKSDLYIQISAGDYMRVEKVSYKNNITIVVCGYLEIGEFTVEEDDDGAFLNNVNIVICPNGFLKATKLELMNNVSIYNYGTLQAGTIIGQASNSSKCIQGTGTFQGLDGNSIIEHDQETDEWYYNGDFLVNGSWWNFGEGCSSMGENVPLPVELLSFNHKNHPDYVELQWVTASEINNDFYTLERSTNLYHWDILGYQKGAGTINEIRHYHFNDYSPVEGMAYYRLKQTDFDGAYEYFGPIAVDFNAEASQMAFQVLKSPSVWSVLCPADESFLLEVYSLNGNKIYSGTGTGRVSFPAPRHPVVIRMMNGSHAVVSRIVM